MLAVIRRLITVILFLLFGFENLAAETDTIVEKERQLAGLSPDTAKVNVLLELGRYYCSRQNDKALLYLQQALTLSNELGYNKGIARSFLWQGRVFYYKDEYALAESYLSKAREILEKTADVRDLAFYHFAAGSLYDLTGNFIMAVQEYQEAARLSASGGDESLRSGSLASLGSVYNRLKEPDNALVYLREALAVREGLHDQIGAASIQTCIGASFEEKGMDDSALFYYLKGYHIRIASKDIRPLASSEYNLGKLYNKMKRYDKAIRIFESANRHYQLLDEKAGLCITGLELARSLNYTGNKNKAATTAGESLNLAIKMNNNELISLSYETLTEIAAFNNDFREAYHYSLLHKKVGEILALQKKEMAIKETEARFRVKQMNDEMEKLKLQSNAQRKNIILLGVSSATLLVILVLIILLYRSKVLAHRRKNQLLEQEALIRRQSDELAEKEKLILREKVETQSRELAAKALEMLRINETMGRIIDRLQQLNNRQASSDDIETEISRIVREIELHTQNNTWQEFDTIFKNIHTEFYNKLLERCPDLTAAEIKIAALLKLNLTTKEIAAITLKSEEGIKSTRYRLRKKLQFTSDDHLVPYLMQL
ncbi:MAG TPA: transcriptional regulator [Bacteroidales bacterium]|nr:transcriptional regulator [Bacteroidales bacterium]